MSNVNVMYQSVCLVFNPITVGNYASFFYCIPNDRASDYYDPDIKLYSFKLVRAGAFLSGVWPTGVQMVIFFCCSRWRKRHDAFNKANRDTHSFIIPSNKFTKHIQILNNFKCD